MSPSVEQQSVTMAAGSYLVQLQPIIFIVSKSLLSYMQPDLTIAVHELTAPMHPHVQAPYRLRHLPPVPTVLGLSGPGGQ